MEKQAQAAEDLRIAEFNSLQAQINPHFLYNTMDMINWMAQQGRTSEVCNAVQSLSRFYKLTLSRKRESVLSPRKKNMFPSMCTCRICAIMTAFPSFPIFRMN
ncbi:MAG: sensor histidine kinase [Ruminococcus sp.]